MADNFFEQIMASIEGAEHEVDEEPPENVKAMLEFLDLSADEFVSLVTKTVQASTDAAVSVVKMGIEFEPAILVMGMVAEGMIEMHMMTMLKVYNKITDIPMPEDEEEDENGG